MEGKSKAKRLARAEPECDPARCRSKKDAAAVVAAVAGSADDIATLAFLALGGRCARPGEVVDELGRTALHVAASTGKTAVVEWLLRFADAAINAKDHESGYTALHRAALYGQLGAADLLLSSGANVSLNDADGLSAVDHLVRDQRCLLDLSPNNPCEVYAWGSNSNFNLGLGHHQQRAAPEPLDFFRREGAFCRSVSLQKFHSAFLTSAGQVYTCGHGRGGRLGHGDEESQLSPRPVKTLQGHVVKEVALGVDHSVFLTSAGSVWTCGTNTYHQLGQTPVPKMATAPMPVGTSSKAGKGGVVGSSRLPAAEGVCAGRFHSLFWTRDSLYTWGLNAGHLGHIRGERTIPAPKLVSSLNEKGTRIKMATCSDGAVIVLTETGEILALHEYQNRRVASRHHDVAKIVVAGGHLDAKAVAAQQAASSSASSSGDLADGFKAVERGGQDLRVYVLTNLGRLLIWEEDSSQLFSCVFNLNREVLMSDVAVTRTHQLLLLSKEGLAYEGSHLGKKKGARTTSDRRSRKQSEKMTELEMHLARNPTELVKLKRVPGVFRGTAVASDPKGQNFCALQLLPNASLTELPEVRPATMVDDMEAFLGEASEADLLHDVVFVVDGGARRFPAHKYVVSCASDHMSNLIVSAKGAPAEVAVNGVDPAVFAQLLKFCYTKTCDLMRPGPCAVPYTPKKPMKQEEESAVVSDEKDEAELIDPGQSAFVVHSKKKGKQSKKGKNKANRAEAAARAEDAPADDNAFTALQEAAKNLGFHGMTKALENYRFQDGCVVSRERTRRPPPPPVFSRKSFPELHDVVVATEDGADVAAHRCVLAARLEYFRSMFGLGWSESGGPGSSRLSLPVNSKVLTVLVDFLYRGDAPSALTSCEDVEFLGRLMMVSDQLLVGRLSQMCERQLSQLLTLRNVADVLQFSFDLGGASTAQLRASAMQFTCLNLAALMESRSLCALDGEVLGALTDYYRQEHLPGVMSRRTVAFSGGPSPQEMEDFMSQYPADLTKEDIFRDEMVTVQEGKQQQRQGGPQATTASASAKKRSSRRHSSGDKGVAAAASSSTCQRTRRRRRRNASSSSVSSGTSDSGSDAGFGGGASSSSAAEKNPSSGSNLSLDDLDFEEKVVTTGPLTVQPRQETAATADATNGNFLADFFAAKPATELDHHPRHESKTNQFFSKKFAKKSQKERKREMAEAEVAPKSPPTASASKWAGWGPASPNTSADAADTKKDLKSVPSLSDIMKSESVTPQKNRPLQQSTPPSSSSKQKKQKWKQLDLTPEAPAGDAAAPAATSNPWKVVGQGGAITPGTTTTTTPAAAASPWKSFDAIQMDQTRQSANARRARSKALWATQAEERAIQELRRFYNADGVFDEHIEVVRVGDGAPVEAPVWKRL